MKKNIILAILLPIIFASLFKAGTNFDYNTYKDITSTLLAISGMIFTIMGIWIAFLYPNALLKITNKNLNPADFSETSEDTKRLEAIVGSIIKSSLIATSILILYLLKAIISETQIYQEHIHIIKISALTITIYLCYFQIESVVQVVYANISFLNDIHSKRASRIADDQLHK